MKSRFLYKLLILFITVFSLSFFICDTANGQDASSGNYVVDLKLKYKNVDDTSRMVTITVTREEGNLTVPVKWAIVNLYLNENSKLGMLGNITTNENGEGVIPLHTKFKFIIDSLGLTSYKFIASLQNNPGIESSVNELNIQEAGLKLEIAETNSTGNIMATLMAKDSSGKMNPVEGSLIHFAVQYSSDTIPLTTNPVRTNSKGVAAINFPDTIESDGSNLLNIIATTDELDRFGLLVSKKKVNRDYFQNKVNSLSDAESFSRGNLIAFVLIITGIIGTTVYFFKRNSKSN